ncbi:MAG TPA: hypothetical protein VJ698_05720 [Noviherbaspirillum sp.]|uniref:hypothetical protein n=1 Tax=Noviherbaspirillum sp. TaxID=1926288 RepID=UPI002B49DBF1|nr:hypothetical protein [Noviherbaspirillum sp.]HJV84953.1 hypothetical protein [Noviherbaspirillum sp.]
MDSMIYKFDAVWKADAFEANLAAADVEYCLREHQPVETHRVDHDLRTAAAKDVEISTEEM